MTRNKSTDTTPLHAALHRHGLFHPAKGGDATPSRKSFEKREREREREHDRIFEAKNARKSLLLARSLHPLPLIFLISPVFRPCLLQVDSRSKKAKPRGKLWKLVRDRFDRDYAQVASFSKCLFHSRTARRLTQSYRYQCGQYGRAGSKARHVRRSKLEGVSNRGSGEGCSMRSRG